jgi:phosphoenolpyruvate carboxykinase (GTP)
VALCPDGTVWWEGLSKPPEEAIDWKGQRWMPASPNPAAHPNSRFTAPAGQCPSISPEWENPEGVPISAIIFGGRRSTTMPLVFQAFNWQHGTYLGATMTSERTAAAAGKVGELRHDPMAMLPFCGYNMADYWRHWLEMGRRGGEQMPRIFHVNWFRKAADGRYLWPGFGANMRVLEWIIGRVRHETDATETPIGYLPTADQLGSQSLGVSARDIQALLAVDPLEWQNEAAEREGYFEQFGEKLPAEIRAENEALRRRLGG